MDGKGGRRVRLTTLPPSCAHCLEIWGSQPPGTLRGCTGLYWDCLHHPNNRLENIFDIHLPHFNFVVKNLFVSTECDGEAFAPCNPMYACNNISILPQVGYSQSGSHDIHKRVSV